MPNQRITLPGVVLSLFIGTVALVIFAEIAVRLTMPNWHEFHSGRFMGTGLTKVPGFPSVLLARKDYDGYFAQNNGDFRVRIRTNDFNLRDDEPLAAADGRIWIIGDSMAFGWGVERNETYTQVIGDTLGIPTYNIASPGTDVCGYQALWGRMPSTVRPRAVVMGLILENDMEMYDCAEQARLANEPSPSAPPPSWWTFGNWTEFKWRLTGVSALYNFLAVTVKRMGVVEEALVEMGLLAREHVEEDRFSAARMDAVVESTANAVADMRKLVPHDVPFVVLIAPARFEIRDGSPFFHELRLKTVAALKQRGIDVVDPFAEFAAAGFAPTHFAHDGHWSKVGHAVAGKAIAQWFRDSHALAQ
jgi:hypothetical protein